MAVLYMYNIEHESRLSNQLGQSFQSMNEYGSLISLWPRSILLIRVHLLRTSEVPIRSFPQSTECKTRMHCRQRNNSKSDHSAIQNQEVRFVVPKISSETLPQLCNTEDRPDENRKRGKEQANAKDFEQSTLSYPLLLCVHVEYSFMATPAEVHEDENENEEANGLQEKTGNHDVYSDA